MIPDVGATCAFTFTSRFAVLNGVYRVRTETTFRDALASGIDFVTSFYIPAGLQQSDFEDDQLSYRQDRVVILESVINTNTVYYAPESTFATVPDATIKEYYNLILVSKLGVHQNTQVILPLLDQIKDLVESSLGIADPCYVTTNAQNKVYLTDAQYATLEATRQAQITQLIPWSVRYKQLQDQNTYLAAKVAAYEALLANTLPQTS